LIGVLCIEWKSLIGLIDICFDHSFHYLLLFLDHDQKILTSVFRPTFPKLLILNMVVKVKLGQ
jgi:hypothetical protein